MKGLKSILLYDYYDHNMTHGFSYFMPPFKCQYYPIGPRSILHGGSPSTLELSHVKVIHLIIEDKLTIYISQKIQRNLLVFTRWLVKDHIPPIPKSILCPNVNTPMYRKPICLSNQGVIGSRIGEKRTCVIFNYSLSFHLII